jgi:hypothetical protein
MSKLFPYKRQCDICREDIKPPPPTPLPPNRAFLLCNKAARKPFLCLNGNRGPRLVLKTLRSVQVLLVLFSFILLIYICTIVYDIIYVTTMRVWVIFYLCTVCIIIHHTVCQNYSTFNVFWNHKTLAILRTFRQSP